MAVYSLRARLLGHEQDVRAVCPALYPEGAILSTSRDVTTRIWVPKELGSGFEEGTVFSGHSGYISSVCVLPATEEYPHGLIATGSKDNNINVYNLNSPFPLYKLQGHTDNVCALAAGRSGILLSGSWDKTARVWLGQKTHMTLSGHSLAVWCVAIIPGSGLMITGSADKLIKVWKAGKCEATLQGHEDCVRGLAVISDQEFLSCSNDSSIRRWSVSGHVLQIYYSHMNFVYSVCMIPGTSHNFVSVSEDRSLKVWRRGDCVQTITHPCTSVWCVSVLANGDIITGGSDGVVRVFTTDSNRTASEEDQAAFEEEVSASKIPTQVGDIHVDKLPGPEILQTPGKKEGATQMVRQGTAVEAYQWSSADMKWNKIGDVVGASDSNTGRTLHEGKEYDFVFSVDVEEGKPPLALPYNMTEDPWYAAQRFITKHGLSQLFLDQIHDFIVERTKSVSMSQLPANQSYRDPFTGASSYVPGGTNQRENGSYSDPFTGGGRYVPSTYSTELSANSVPSRGADPFTGSGSYRPDEAKSSSLSLSNEYFPQKQPVTFSTIKPESVIGKLKEFNNQLPGSLKSESSDLDAMSLLCNINATPTEKHFQYLWRLLHWPKDKVFPAMDILRMGLLNQSVVHYYCLEKQKDKFVEFVTAHLAATDIIQTHLLAIRILANLAAHNSGQQILMEYLEKFTEHLVPTLSSSNKNVQIAACTVLLNMAVILQPTEDSEGKSLVLDILNVAASSVSDSEAKFRVCVAVGTLVWQNEAALTKAQSLRPFIEEWKSSRDSNKLQDCAATLSVLLQA